MDNIPYELIKHAGEETLKFITALFHKNCEEKKWPMESVVVNTPAKERKHQAVKKLSDNKPDQPS